MRTMLLLLTIPTMGQSNTALTPLYIVPIKPSDTTAIHVFCFTDTAHDVSFQSNKKCEDNCGYYEGQNTCCKVFDIAKDTTIQCFQSSNLRRLFQSSNQKVKENVIKFVALLIQSEKIINVTHVISDQKQSTLTCIEDPEEVVDTVPHPTDSFFYVKFAYSYNGDVKDYGSFKSLKTVNLPVNGATLLCNGSIYMLKRDISEVYESLDEVNKQLKILSKSHQMRTNLVVYVVVFVIIVLFLCLVWIIIKRKLKNNKKTLRNPLSALKKGQSNRLFTKQISTEQDNVELKDTADEVLLKDDTLDKAPSKDDSPETSPSNDNSYAMIKDLLIEVSKFTQSAVKQHPEFSDILNADTVLDPDTADKPLDDITEDGKDESEEEDYHSPSAVPRSDKVETPQKKKTKWYNPSTW